MRTGSTTEHAHLIVQDDVAVLAADLEEAHRTTMVVLT